MATKKDIPATKISRKEIGKEIDKQLVTALQSFKVTLGQKKFNSLLKKTSQLFADGLIKARKKNKGKSLPEKEVVTPKKPAVKKKAVEKKVVEKKDIK